MKKAYKFIIALLILVFSLGSIALGANGRVMDETGFFGKEEKSALENRLSNLSDKYAFDMWVVVSHNLNAQEEAESFVLEGSLEERGGIVFSFESATKECYILPYGEGLELFASDRVQSLYEEVSPYIDKAKVYEGINAYIRQAEKIVAQSKTLSGEGMSAVDYKGHSRLRIIIIALSLIIGIFVSMGITYSMKKSMEDKNVQGKESASGFLLRITKREDIYLKTEEEEL